MLDPDPHHTGKPDPYPIRNNVLDNPKFPQRMCAEVQYGVASRLTRLVPGEWEERTLRGLREKLCELSE